MSSKVKRPPTKAAQREASIERIIEAALNRILTRGYYSTTVEDIAKDAGMTKGAVYFYFESKGAVLMALLDRIEVMMVDSMIDRVALVGSLSEDQLVAAIHSQGALATDPKFLMLFMVALIEFTGTGDPIEKRLHEIYTRFYGTLEDIVEEGQRKGEFRSELSTRELASIVVALEHGTLMEWYLRSECMDGATLVRAARTVLLRGILMDPSATETAPAQVQEKKKSKKAPSRTKK